MPTRSLTAFAATAIVALVVAAPALPAPSNDNFANATVVSSLPFSETVPIAQATTEPGEPGTPSGQSRTVWYSFTPASDVVIRAHLGASDYVTASMPVYRADGPGFPGLTEIARVSYVGTTFRLQAGARYYLQGGDGSPFGWVSVLGVSLAAVPPPPNDDFADAVAFTSVPFSDNPALEAATVEPAEPTGCGATFAGSAWYAFTPTASGSYGAFAATGINVYRGTSLAGLTSIACSEWPGLYFYADAGETYYLQYFGGGLRIDVVPPPDVGFRYSPAQPSIFDDVSFEYWIGGYFDPTVTGHAWDFGDGTTATGAATSHRFTADGDYAVTLTVFARGGRTSSQTQVVRVRSLTVSGQGRFGTDRNGVASFSVSNDAVTLERARGQSFSFAGEVTSVTGAGNAATLGGAGTWNGESGYTFEVSVVDGARVGRLADTIEVVIRDASGVGVFTSSGPQLLKAGDITVESPTD